MAYIGGTCGEQIIVAPNYTPKCGGCNSDYHGRGNCSTTPQSQTSWYQKPADNQNPWICNDQPSASEPVTKKQAVTAMSADAFFSRISQLFEASLAPIRAAHQEIVEGQRALTKQVETLRRDITGLKSRQHEGEMTKELPKNSSTKKVLKNSSSTDSQRRDDEGHNSSGDQDEDTAPLVDNLDSDKDPSSPKNDSETEKDPNTKESTQTSELIYGIRINKKKSFKKSWDKQHYCKFCEKPVLKLPRHLEDRHDTEAEVMEFLQIPPKDPKRREIIDKIRNEGNFMHNQKVLISGTGELFTKRRQGCDSQDNAHLDNYIVCSICHVAVRSKSLARHRRLIHLKRKHQDPSSSENVNASDDATATREYRRECERFLPLINLEGVSTEFKHAVLNIMRPGPITTVAKQDELILNYGQKVFEHINKHDTKINLREIDKKGKKTNAYISQKMRELARLLISFRKFVDDDKRTMRSILKSEEVPNLIQTIKVLAECETETKQLKKPTLARHCGISVKHMASFAKEAAIENNDKEFVDDLDAFTTAYEAKWNSEVSRLAINTIKKRRLEKRPPPLYPISQTQSQVIHQQPIYEYENNPLFLQPQPFQEQYISITQDIHQYIQIN
ncbi:uncharacterized protein LOC135833914 [Planococcus citri]|uniref:uncharacterized protein LOC135833914 n=1 Tax=Planococcus citri TaxID=170843 RepID=UPI0031F9F195